MFHTRILLPLLLATSVAVAADGPLVHLDLSLTNDKLLKTWKVLPDEADKLSVEREGAQKYLHLATSAPENVFLRRTVPLPEGATNLALTYRVRALGVTRGEKSYHLPRIALQWDNDPNFQHQTVCAFKGDKTEWEQHTLTVPIPEGAKSLRLHAGIFSCMATFDIATLDVDAK